MKKIGKKNKKSLALSLSKGFSIIEVMMAATVLTVGIAAAVGLIGKSLAESISIRDSIIATNLAQEGVELMRSLRDNSWLTIPPPACDSKPFCNFQNNTTCIIKNESPLDLNCANLDYKLYYKNNFYVHDNGSSTATKFQRKVAIKCIKSDGTGIGGGETCKDNAVKAEVKSTVIWGASFPGTCSIGEKCVEVEETLTNWRQ